MYEVIRNAEKRFSYEGFKGFANISIRTHFYLFGS